MTTYNAGAYSVEVNKLASGRAYNVKLTQTRGAGDISMNFGGADLPDLLHVVQRAIACFKPEDLR